MIPDCYDPVFQAERRERVWDEYRRRTPCCDLCRETIRPGCPYRECSTGTVCEDCFEALMDNVNLYEED